MILIHIFPWIGGYSKVKKGIYSLLWTNDICGILREADIYFATKLYT